MNPAQEEILYATYALSAGLAYASFRFYRYNRKYNGWIYLLLWAIVLGALGGFLQIGVF